MNDNITNNSNRLKDVIRSYFDGEVLLDIDFNKQVSFYIYIYIMFNIFIKSYFIINIIITIKYIFLFFFRI